MEKKKVWFTCFLFFAALALTACSAGNPTTSAASDHSGKKEVELYILAAASLAEPMKEIKPLYEKDHTSIKLVTTFGSSGMLQQQIEQGAPADLFISAANKQMQTLIDKGMINTDKASDLLKNELVLIVPKTLPLGISRFQDLSQPAVAKVAIGQPETVPAGTYAKETLTKLSLWDSVKPKLIYTKDVTQVLTYVETGNVDAGIVYQTDAHSSDKVTVIATADADTHKPIVYPAGIVKVSKNQAEANAFYEWLQSSEADAIFSKYGFQKAK